MDSYNLGEFLKSVRTRRNLSLRAAAELLNVSHTYLDKLEKGKNSYHKSISKPGPDVLKKISAGYGISYDHLLELAGYIPQSLNRSYIADSKDLDQLMLEFLMILDSKDSLSLGSRELSDDERDKVRNGLAVSYEVIKKLI